MYNMYSTRPMSIKDWVSTKETVDDIQNQVMSEACIMYVTGQRVPKSYRMPVTCASY